MSGVDLGQFQKTYITECYELLTDMEARLLALDVDNPALDDLHAIFRCAHSVKGGAGAFGFDAIAKFTHTLEAVLDALREFKVTLTTGIVDTLLKSVDVLTAMVRAAERGDLSGHPDAIALAEALEKQAGIQSHGGGHGAAKAAAAAPSGPRTYRIRFAPHKDLFQTGNEPLLILRELSTLGTLEIKPDLSKLPAFDDLKPEECYIAWDFSLVSEKDETAVREVFEFVTDVCDLSITAESAKANEHAREEASAAAQASEKQQAQGKLAAGAEAAPSGPPQATIRVDVSKLDRLVNMVGELVITQAMLQAQTRDLPMEHHTELLRGVDELCQHTRELQEAVMSVRMQPVRSVFSRMPRLVRDLAQRLGKKARLEMSGENTEVDKTVIEQLSDPLTHMIRNAIDHGVEMPEDRIAAGKEEEAVIRLSADHRGGQIVIEIIDDGRGLNRAKILDKARQKGLVAPDAELTPNEIENLVFLPGFSTADAVTDVSGRGVGMDVVRRNIEGLGGSVHIASEPGKGSHFSVSLPLTLAILDGMIVRVGAEHYIVPIASIIETLRPKANEVRKVADGNDVINVRGEFVSVVYLYRMFSVRNAESDASKALVVLLESGRKKIGLVVDELIGQQQVVIKSLEGNSGQIPGVSGATILGDGKVSLILDTAGIGKLVSTHYQEETKKQIAA